jgi:hypothetical protein
MTEVGNFLVKTIEIPTPGRSISGISARRIRQDDGTCGALSPRPGGSVFAVSGTWKMDNSMRERQAAVLPQLVAGVSQNPGFVRGFWADDLDDPDVSVTFVVFETLDQARSFREAVMANAPAQVEVGVERAGLRIVEIQADA